MDLRDKKQKSSQNAIKNIGMTYRQREVVVKIRIKESINLQIHPNPGIKMRN